MKKSSSARLQRLKQVWEKYQEDLSTQNEEKKKYPAKKQNPGIAKESEEDYGQGKLF